MATLQSFIDPILPAAEEAVGATFEERPADPLLAAGVLGVAGGVFNLATLEVEPVTVS